MEKNIISDDVLHSILEELKTNPVKSLLWSSKSESGSFDVYDAKSYTHTYMYFLTEKEINALKTLNEESMLILVNMLKAIENWALVLREKLIVKTIDDFGLKTNFKFSKEVSKSLAEPQILKHIVSKMFRHVILNNHYEKHAIEVEAQISASLASIEKMKIVSFNLKKGKSMSTIKTTRTVPHETDLLKKNGCVTISHRKDMVLYRYLKQEDFKLI